MRRCRETRHETLFHVSQALRIRAPYLRAIEEDDWRALPNSVYARAFLRSYAVYVEADPEQVLKRAEAVLDSRPGPDTPLPPLPVRDRSLPGGALVGASVLLAIAAYAGWYYFSVERLRDERVVAALPDRLMTDFSSDGRLVRESPVIDSPLPAADVDTPLPATEREAPAANGAASPEQDIAQSAGPTPDEAGGGAAGDVRPGLPAVAAPVPQEPSAQRRAALEEAGDVVFAPNGIIFHAVEPTYIEVRSLETNEVLLERLLRKDERYRAPDRGGLVLSVGNAGGLEITVDGISVPRLGASGEVMRDIPINRDLLLQGRAGG